METVVGAFVRGAGIVLVCALTLLVTSGAAADEQIAPGVFSFENLPGAEPGSQSDQGIQRQLDLYDEWTAAGDQTEERSASETAHVDLGDSAAINLLMSTFGDQLAALSASPFEALSHADQIFGFRSDHVAVINPEGAEDRSLLVSSLPLRSEDGEPTDLSLEATGEGFAPKVPVAPVDLPKEVSDPITFGGTGVAVSLAGASEDSSSPILRSTQQGESSDLVTFANVKADTDYLVTPTPTGAESFAQLRSKDSPEVISFDIERPSDSSIIEGSDGGLTVTGAGDAPLMSILPPSATDAEGGAVPVTMDFENGQLSLKVPHRGNDYAYPILVDPTYQYETYDFYHNTSNTFYGWSSYKNAAASNLTHSLFCPSALYGHDDCGGSGQGLFVNAAAGQTVAAGADARYLWVPPGYSTFINHAWLSSIEFRKGPNPGTQPMGYFGIASGVVWNQKVAFGYNFGGGIELSGGTSARQLAVGLDNLTGSAAKLGTGWQNTRYNRLSYFTVELGDGEDPVVNPPVTTNIPEWVGPGVAINATVAAGDAGTGIYRVQTSSPSRTGGPGTYYLTNSYQGCTGGPASRCPWAHNFPLSLNESKMPEGVNTVHVKGYDVLGKPSPDTTFPVRIDRTKPELRVSGSLVAASKDSIPLTEANYPLTIKADDRPDPSKATNLFANMWATVLYVDGIAKATHGYAPCTSTTSCATQDNFPFNPDDYSEGNHSVRILIIDRAGNSQEVTLPVTVDRVDNVVHVKLYDGDPANGGTLKAEEWKIRNLLHSRTESDGEIETRRVYRCNDATVTGGFCTETRNITAGPVAGEYASAETRSSPASDDSRLSYQGILTPMPPGTPTETGLHTAVLPAWVHLPPGHGTGYNMYQQSSDMVKDVGGTPTNATVITKLYYDSTTYLPTKFVTSEDGVVTDQSYFDYGTNLNRSSLASDFFGPPIPNDVASTSEIQIRDESWQGQVVDSDTGDAYTPMYNGSSYWKDGKLYCLKDLVQEDYYEDPSLNDPWEPDPNASAEENEEMAPDVYATSESQFVATYYEAGPNGCLVDPPQDASIAVEMHSFNSESGAAQEWVNTYQDQVLDGTWSAAVYPVAFDESPPTTQETVSLDSTPAEAYLVPIGPQQASMLVDNGDTQVQIAGDLDMFVDDNHEYDLQSVVESSEGR